MNQIDLILENIRLGHINQLMLEATTPDEVNRGVALINESMQTVYGVLQEGMIYNGIKRVGSGLVPLVGAGVGAGLGYFAGEGIDDSFDTNPILRNDIIDHSNFSSGLNDVYVNHGLSGTLEAAKTVGNVLMHPTAYTGAVIGGTLGTAAGLSKFNKSRINHQ
jgi:hypothetical protein